jgi:ubiquinone/menaquinone biosynthesis C-methylase UbiE
MSDAQLILEVGAGTGVISNELASQVGSTCFGVDILPEVADFASCNSLNAQFLAGDGHFLPFPDGSMDISLCHFLFLWVDSAPAVLQEMRRVTRPGGAILALAEPDYGGRLDYPESLSHVGNQQLKSLLLQGANPTFGRQLRTLFSNAGLENVFSGVLGGEWGSFDEDEFSSEWETLSFDLRESLGEEELNELRTRDLAARAAGERILYVPTFYALGFVS